MDRDGLASGSPRSPPSTTRLPPPVAYTLGDGPSSLARPLDADIGPPTPPKPKVSTGAPERDDGAATAMSSDSPTGLSQSKSWTQLAPQRPFVNGRGNVQLPGAPQQFIPASSPPSSPVGFTRSNLAGSTQRGQSSSPSRPRENGVNSQEWSSSMVAEEGLPTGPPARPRPMVRTSSRPSPRTSSIASSPRPSVDSPRADDSAILPPLPASLSSHSHLTASSATSTASPPTPVASPRLFPSPSLAATRQEPPTSSQLAPPRSSVLDRGRPRTPDPFSEPYPRPPVSAPITTKRHVPRSSAPSTLSVAAAAPPFERQRSHSPAPSVLDRPRPKTPDLFGTGSPAPSIKSASSASGSPTLTRTAAPTSVLDRPRPRTPDPGAVFRFGEETGTGGSTDRTRTPEPSSVFSYNVARGPSSVDGHAAPRSILDRPRPRTPDPQGWLDSASVPSFVPPSKPPSSSPSSFVQSSTSSLPHSGSSASIPSISRPSFDSTAPSLSAFSASSSASRPYTSTRSRQSTDPASSAVSDAPLLNLDFDFGSAFGASDTMFGLSDLLSFGTESKTGTSAPSGQTAAPAPAPAPPPPSTSAPSRPIHAYSTSSSSVNLLHTRNLPRKEAPKVDLQLELELEIERALPDNGTLGERSELERKREREISGATQDSERERERDAALDSGRKTPSFVGNAMGKMRRKGDSISSMRSVITAGSISEASVTTGGSPQPATKRRRRRSLASLLSLASNSGRGSEGDQRSRTPEPNMIGAPVLMAVNGTPTGAAPYHQSPASFGSDGRFDTSIDKTLPPTPISLPSPEDDRTPPASAASQQIAPRPDHSRTPSGGNALTRQLSRLRQRSDGSTGYAHSASSHSRPGFQVVSGSTTRNRGAGHGSVSSFSSSRNTHSSRDDSLDPSYSRETAPFTALPLSEPPMSSSATSRAPPSASPSVPFGRRLVQRFTGSRTGEDGSSQSWTMPLKDHEEQDPKPRRRPPRRSSFSSLLNLGESSSKAKAQESRKKTILGMSLPAGRKSDDLLARGQGLGTGHRPAWDAVRGSASDTGHETTYGGRRSFDLLTDREAIPRRPSTDNLLSLASAKLSKMALSDDAGDPSSPSPLTPSANGHNEHGSQSGDESSLTSGQSTPSFGTPENSAPVITTAHVVKRNDSSPPKPFHETESPLSSRTAAPVLMRSDSLRTTPRQSMPSTSGAEEKNPRVATEPEPKPAALWKKRGKVPDSGLGSDASMSSAWLDLEDALAIYSRAVQENQVDRAVVITNTLLPFLKKEEDNPATRTNERLAKRQRDILFGWLAVLTTELREMQPAHRGACLEAVAAIAESHFLSACTLEDDAVGQARYRTAVVSILQFAVEKLNDKAVYANTLVFSGRVFALAFFRIEGVALKLLRALPPVKRHGLKRILEEAGVDENRLPPVDLEAYPSHLASLCLRNFRTYTSLLLPMAPRPTSPDDQFLVRDGNIVVEMAGNWLIRWTASDSDLPFAFYRAYHKQLAAVLIPVEAREDIVIQPAMSPSTIITAPGFLFLAASLLDKSDALVHRNLRSVTSIGPNSNNFNTNDSANLSFGQKPKVLELAHRRLVQTMLDIVGGPPSAPGEAVQGSWDAESRRYAFSRMLQVWIRACVKRTSMWDTRSVFILLDLVEGLIYTLSYPTPSSRSSSDEDAPVPKPDERCLEMFDFPFLFSVIKKILLEADNTVTLMRTISFIYAHFEIFTMRVKDRSALCEGIILDEAVFSRLFLSYNQGTRGFWIRLLVWRLSRLGVVAKEQNPSLPPDEGILALFGLLNVRLEAIRKRHDQLEPLDDLREDDDLFRPKRSTICSTRGVKEAPWTVDEFAEAVEEEESDVEDEPQELVRAIPPPPSSTSSAGGGSTKKGDNKTVSKVVSWLKGGLGKNKKGLKVNIVPDPQIDPFLVERTATIRKLNGEDDSSSIVSQQDLPKSTLPTTIETGAVPNEPSRPPASNGPPATPEKNGLLSPNAPRRNKSNGSGSSGSDRRSSRPTSPAFFSFEFENGVITRSDVDPSVAAAASSNASAEPALPTSPIRRTANAHPDPQAAVSPRVSLRFSKRISILPPAALDLMKKDGRGVTAVPPIPDQYRQSIQAGYDKKFHPYAVRGLRDLEDSYDEWTDWVARLQEEEDNGAKVNTRSFVDVVPRLAVSWPTSFTDD
ncbi:hypothetical protein JCM10212_003797 [Sporobolomyces blumeae]